MMMNVSDESQRHREFDSKVQNMDYSIVVIN